MESSQSNTWVETYLEALLSSGLSTEYQKKPNQTEGAAEAVDADKQLFARYYVHQILQMDEDALRAAWSKATSTSHGRRELDVRLEYLSWRAWFMKRKRDAVRAQPALDHFELSSTGSDSRDISDDEAESPRIGSSSDVSLESNSAATSSASALDLAEHVGKAAETVAQPMQRRKSLRVKFDDIPEEEPASIDIFSIQRAEKLYIVLISMHGLVRGEAMELGKDPDTGGQVKYVVELARALALLPWVYRVELMTRQILDPKVDPSYGMPEERLGPAEGLGPLEGSFIVRIPCGPPNEYLRKEALWPYIREFADRAVFHVEQMLQRLRDSGNKCELYAVHGHYADAGEVASLIASTLNADMLMTGHSLGRNKLEHLRASGTMTRAEIEASYAISRRIEGEERSLDSAMVVFTSTQQEIDQQWGLYDGYEADPPKLPVQQQAGSLLQGRWGLAHILRVRMHAGRAMPLMRVIPPGLDFSSLKVELPEDQMLKKLRWHKAREPASVHGSFLNLAGMVSPASQPATPLGGQSEGDNEDAFDTPKPFVTAAEDSANDNHGTADSLGIVRDDEPAIWKEVFRFLRHPRKPAILAMSRPDAKKNITTLVKAFANNELLRQHANLVLIMGNRDNIDGMAAGSAKVLTQVLKLIDTYDLYGSVAYPKHHKQTDISDIYMLATRTRGVFTNVALQEPFGLTVIEAAAHGVPTVATANGGPVDIMKTLHHGVVVDPTDPQAIADELVRILTNPGLWDSMSTNGRKNIMLYSWYSHCVRVMETVECDKRRSQLFKRHQYSHSSSWDAETLGVGNHNREGSTNRLSLDAAVLKGGEGNGATNGAVPATEGIPHQPSSAFRSMKNLQARVPLTNLFTASTVPGIMEEPVGLPQVGSGSHNLGKTLSNMSNDDSFLLEPVTPIGPVMPAGPLVGHRERFIAVQLDGSFAAAATARALEDLMDAALEVEHSDKVGLGVVSMLGFDDTRELLQEAEVPLHKMDFVVCNSGADIWFNFGPRNPSGNNTDCYWQADASYEQHIEFRWDRQSVNRTLGKWASTPSPRLPIKALMRNLREEEKGQHPHHLTLELDATTRTVLLSSMSGAATQRRLNVGGTPAKQQLAQAYASYPPTILLERLRKRLRRFGFRVTLTLQMVPQRGAENTLVVLHVTPLRASRSLALRYIMHALNKPMEDMALVLFPRKMREIDEEGQLLSAFTSDLGDLVAGWQKVWVVTPAARLLYSSSRSMSMEYKEPSLEESAEEDELAPVEKLSCMVSEYDLSDRVTAAREVATLLQHMASARTPPTASIMVPQTKKA